MLVKCQKNGKMNFSISSAYTIYNCLCVTNSNHSCKKTTIKNSRTVFVSNATHSIKPSSLFTFLDSGQYGTVDGTAVITANRPTASMNNDHMHNYTFCQFTNKQNG